MIVGTTNPNKLREIAAICMPLGVFIDYRSLDVPETETSFEGNARLKALGYSAQFPSQYVLVEDSGLVVPALHGLPGPWSARFDDLDISTKEIVETKRPREVIDLANNKKVLSLLDGVAFEQRGAYFVICLNIARHDEILFTATCKRHGWIATEMRGTNGFGYDPIFIGQDTFGKTYAEIDSHRKNLRSHRNEALKQLEVWLSDQVKRGVSL